MNDDFDDSAAEQTALTAIRNAGHVDPVTKTQNGDEPKKYNDRESQILVSRTSSRIAYHDSGQLGCKHYRRSCKVKAPCCDEFYVCRFCHDSAQNHRLDRYDIDVMLCMECVSEQRYVPQKPAKDCFRCGANMARYYCDICHLWDNHPDRDIFHCEKCGLCRRGKRDMYAHCDTCNMCRTKAEHKCIQNVLHSHCPYCREYLHTSKMLSAFLSCGSGVHMHCLKLFIQTYTVSYAESTPLRLSSSSGHLDMLVSILQDNEARQADKITAPLAPRFHRFRVIDLSLIVQHAVTLGITLSVPIPSTAFSPFSGRHNGTEETKSIEPRLGSNLDPSVGSLLLLCDTNHSKSHQTATIKIQHLSRC